MKFNIVKKKNTKEDGFYLSLRFMFGDADSYTTETHYFSPDNIDGLVNIVDLCEVLCGYDNFGSYEKNNFYKKIFNIFGWGDECSYWKFDYRCDCFATLDSYKVTAVKHGVEYNVKVTFDENDLSWYNEDTDTFNYQTVMNRRSL